MALAGFTLLHLGNIYDGAPKYDQFQVNKSKIITNNFFIINYYIIVYKKIYENFSICIENDL